MFDEFDWYGCQALRPSSFTVQQYSWSYQADAPSVYVFESWVKVRDISAKWVRSRNEKWTCGALAGLFSAAYRAYRSSFKERGHSARANGATFN